MKKIVYFIFLSFTLFTFKDALAEGKNPSGNLSPNIYRLSVNASKFDITAFNTCKRFTNTSSISYMIPTGSIESWNSFLNHLPQGVSAEACVTDKDCDGSWSACSGSPAKKTYSISVAASGNGKACAAPDGAHDFASCSEPAGACGVANGTTPKTEPAANLCTKGTPSAVSWSANSKWTWSCAGSTSSASCSATADNKWAYCFVAGTQVTLESGRTKKIEDIRVGESVITYDEITESMTSSPVKEIFHHETNLSTLFTFHYGAEVLTSNDQHRFYLPKEDAYMSAAEIYINWKQGKTIHFLSLTNEEVLVKKIDIKEENVPLYNLHVKGRYDDSKAPEKDWQSLANHNYFANGVLVHNVKWCGGKSEGNEMQSAASSCDDNTGFCNFGSNVMTCNFPSPSKLSSFETCLMTKDYSACPTPGVPVNGTCGTAINVPTATEPTNLCTTGTASTITKVAGYYKWFCRGGGTGSQDSYCDAPALGKYVATKQGAGGMAVCIGRYNSLAECSARPPSGIPTSCVPEEDVECN